METIRNTIAENLTGGNKIASSKHQFTHDDIPDLSGKVAVVTGGSEGIGYGCTHALLTHNISKLFILSPSHDVVAGALAAIKSELGADIASRASWLHCDLSDWTETQRVAKEITSQTSRLDILINNAARGIMSRDDDAHGIEKSMSANHIGHVVLTSELLPLLKRTADEYGTSSDDVVRIANMSSNLHSAIPTNTKFESVEELNAETDPQKLYGRTKLCAILYSRYLARHLKDSSRIVVNATHPGVVETRQSTEHIFDAYPLGGYAMKYGLAPFKKDQFEGALSMLYAATVTKGSGQYICPPAIVEEGSKESQDEQLAENLMKLTKDIVKNKEGIELTSY